MSGYTEYREIQKGRFSVYIGKSKGVPTGWLILTNTEARKMGLRSLKANEKGEVLVSKVKEVLERLVAGVDDRQVVARARARLRKKT